MRAPTGKSGEKDPISDVAYRTCDVGESGRNGLRPFPPWAVLSIPGSIVFQLPDGGIDRVPPLNQGFEL